MAIVNRQDARRFEAGGSSARSLLLTVLGEFVRPRAAPAWTGALVAGLAEVGRGGEGGPAGAGPRPRPTGC